MSEHERIEKVRRERAGKTREAPVPERTDRLQEIQRTRGNAAVGRVLRAKRPVAPPVGDSRHAFEFRIGGDVPAVLARAAKEAAHEGPITTPQLRRLQRVARDQGPMTSTQRMFLAGLLDPDNARALARMRIAPGATVNFPLGSIRAGMPQLKRSARPPAPQPTGSVNARPAMSIGRAMPVGSSLARTAEVALPPAERVTQMIAEGDSTAIQRISEEDLAISTPSQRAGMVKVLTDLTWTDLAAEKALVRILRHKGESARVAQALDALGYRKRVLEAVDDKALSAELKELLGQAPPAADAGPIAVALASGSAADVAKIPDFKAATPGQRVGLLRILLEMRASNAGEEARMLDILASAGPGLQELMNQLKGTGLKQALFDHIDAAENKSRLDGLLTPLHDAELDADLVVFRQSAWEGAKETVVEGAKSAWEHFSIGRLIQGLIRTIFSPIETTLDLLEQLEDVLKAPSLDGFLTSLRDIVGTVALWIGALSLAVGGLASLAGATVVLLPGAPPLGVIAVSLAADAAAVGVAFLVLAGLKAALDIGQGAAATTAHERRRKVRDVGDDIVLAAVVGFFKLVTGGLLPFLRRFRRAATDPKAADPAQLKKTADEAQAAEQKIKQDAEAVKAKAPPGTAEGKPPSPGASASPGSAGPKGGKTWTVDPKAWKESLPDRLARIRELEKTDPPRAEAELKKLESDLQEIADRNLKQPASSGDPKLDAEIDAAKVEVEKVTGKKDARIGDEGKGKAVPQKRGPRLDREDIRRAPNETVEEAVARVARVIFQKISETPLKGAWERAVRRTLKLKPDAADATARAAMDKLTDAEMIDAYEKTQPKFWDEVRKDPAAKAWLEQQGFDVDANAAKLKVTRNLPVEQVRVTLDHAAEKASSPRQALDANNLGFEFHDANSMREILQMRHPELRPDKPGTVWDPKSQPSGKTN